MVFQSINPHTQTPIATYPAHTPAEVAAALAAAENAYRHWRKTSFAERAACVHRLADLLLEGRDRYALLMTNEMGKIITEAKAEIEKCAKHARYFATHTETLLAPIDIPTEALSSRIVFDPIGCILAIMPWNYPFWQVMRYAIPAVMSGNVTLLKHAPNVLGCAIAIEALFAEAGFPKGVFQSLRIDVDAVPAVIAADIVQGVTLTGSEYAGSQVAALAGKHIKKTVLELGGSDAFLVLADADIEKAAKVAAQSRMMNTGQACICAKRFMVIKSIKDEFVAALQNHIAAIRYGNPTDPTYQMGVMARMDLADKLRNQVSESMAQGAVVVSGNQSDGCAFAPTILDNIQPGMTAFEQELFGPVAGIITATDEAHAVALANQHRYGLAAAIWTCDLDKAAALSRQLEVGNVFVNALVHSDSRLPFGGVKKSGYGRELGEAGLKEFMNTKTVFMQPA